MRGRAAWTHDFNTDRNIAATFQTLEGASFVVVDGAAQALDLALVTTSSEMKCFSLADTFEGEFFNVTPLRRQGRRTVSMVTR